MWFIESITAFICDKQLHAAFIAVTVVTVLFFHKCAGIAKKHVPVHAYFSLIFCKHANETIFHQNALGKNGLKPGFPG